MSIRERDFIRQDNGGMRKWFMARKWRKKPHGSARSVRKFISFEFFALPFVCATKFIRKFHLLGNENGRAVATTAGAAPYVFIQHKKTDNSILLLAFINFIISHSPNGAVRAATTTKGKNFCHLLKLSLHLCHIVYWLIFFHYFSSPSLHCSLTLTSIWQASERFH